MTTSWTTHPQAPPIKTTSNLNPKHTNSPTNEAIKGQQDGVQDEKREGEAEEKKKFDKKVVNFFITNFPVSSCKTILHDLFAECREILDVYIARKLSKVGKTFGFACFSHVGDVQGLENQLNGITIGLPIHVWCSEAFSQIAYVWGTVLILDEYETNDPNFIYGKVCILTREMHHLNKVIDIKVDGLVTKIRVSESIEDLDSLFGFKKPHMVIKDDLFFYDSVPSWVDDDANDMVREIKLVDGILEGTPVANNEIPAKGSSILKK
uniref:RRM domain-containing protein n=1 Tax=Tanacetum cinerariifolium TaxID=118510 RepID=A0A699KQ23_TANCI|nr:hypothetical protein [Tanacetum cinerariifolium]